MDGFGRSHKKGRGGGRRFEPEGDFIERLEGKDRRDAIPAEAVVARTELARGVRVVDLGAGIGYFTFPMAELAAEVVSIDIEPKMLGVIAERMVERRVDNITLVRGDVTKIPTADSSVDQILAAFIYHEVESQKQLIGECARILRVGGRLDIVDFQKRETSFGPPVSERKTPEHVIATAGKLFRLETRFETDEYYQLGFSKK